MVILGKYLVPILDSTLVAAFKAGTEVKKKKSAKYFENNGINKLNEIFTT